MSRSSLSSAFQPEPSGASLPFGLNRLATFAVRGFVVFGAFSTLVGWGIHASWFASQGLEGNLPVDFRHAAAGSMVVFLVLWFGICAGGVWRSFQPRHFMRGFLIGALALLTVLLCLHTAVWKAYGRIPQQLGGLRPEALTLMLKDAPEGLYREASRVGLSKPLTLVYSTPESFWVRTGSGPVVALKRTQVKAIISRRN